MGILMRILGLQGAFIDYQPRQQKPPSKQVIGIVMAQLYITLWRFEKVRGTAIMKRVIIL